jgi:hypothetical protein
MTQLHTRRPGPHRRAGWARVQFGDRPLCTERLDVGTPMPLHSLKLSLAALSGRVGRLRISPESRADSCDPAIAVGREIICGLREWK